MAINFTRRGNGRTYFTGNTYPVRAEIRRIGGWWDGREWSILSSAMSNDALEDFVDECNGADVAPEAPVAPSPPPPATNGPTRRAGLVGQVKANGTGASPVKSISYLCYYIPTATRFPNPSGALRRRAVRMDGSVWAIPTELVPHSLVNRMLLAGCVVNVVRFADDETEKLLGIVKANLDREIAQAEERMKQAEAEATATMEAAGVDAPTEHAARLARRAAAAEYRKTIERLNKTAQARMEDYRQAARVFGFRSDPVRGRIAEAAGRANALALGAAAKAAAYVEAARKAAEIDPTSHVARAAANDEIPAGPLYDHLQDHGVDAPGLIDG